jgi:O-antigen/teichoic acid export membrane protein
VAIPQLFACLVNSSIRISVAYWHLPLVVLGIAEASINIISFGGAFAFYWHAVESPFRWQPERREVVSLLRLALPLGLSGIFTVVDARIDNLMLGHFLGPEAVGQYSVAGRIVENWNLIAALLVTAFLPALLKAKHDSAERYRVRLHRLYFALFYGMAALALATVLVSSPVITLLFGEAFRPAAAVLRVLVWSTLGAALSYVFSQWAINEQRTSMVAAMVGLGVVAKIALNLLFIRHLQMLGVALATVLAFPIALLATTLPTPHGRTHLAAMVRSLATRPRFRTDT